MDRGNHNRGKFLPKFADVSKRIRSVYQQAHSLSGFQLQRSVFDERSTFRIEVFCSQPLAAHHEGPAGSAYAQLVLLLAKVTLTLSGAGVDLPTTVDVQRVAAGGGCGTKVAVVIYPCMWV